MYYIRTYEFVVQKDKEKSIFALVTNNFLIDLLYLFSFVSMNDSEKESINLYIPTTHVCLICLPSYLLVGSSGPKNDNKYEMK